MGWAIHKDGTRSTELVLNFFCLFVVYIYVHLLLQKPS
jgi:hypothetical protein